VAKAWARDPATRVVDAPAAAVTNVVAGGAQAARLLVTLASTPRGQAITWGPGMAQAPAAQGTALQDRPASTLR
jgi:hypothetical protein